VVDLIDRVIPGEERLSIQKLAHYTSYGPNVHRERILASQNKFWRSIPSSCYVLGQKQILVSLLASKAEVAKLQNAISIHQ